MNTKKLIRAAILTVALVASLTVPTQAAPAKEVVVDQERLSALPPAEQQHVLDLQARMEKLLATDRSTLTRDQRHELRAEWRAMKSEMDLINERSGGTVVYISTAGLIIIILLLIILL